MGTKRQLWVVAVSVLFAGALNCNAFGGSLPAASVAGPKFGFDDFNTAATKTLTAISDMNGGRPALLNGALTTWDTNNSTATNVWTFNWATQQEEIDAQGGITISTYSPFVVNIPAATAGGNNYPGYTAPKDPTNKNSADLGGAVLNLTYSQTAAVQNSDFSHIFTNLHWIQGLTSYYDSGPNRTTIDNPFADGTPYYDDGGAAGTFADGEEDTGSSDITTGPNAAATAYFLDRPYKVESESAETNPVANLTFQMVLADESDNTVDGVTTHTITLYGGYQWGYIYTAGDTAAVPIPLPATASVGFGMLVLFGGFMGLRKHFFNRKHLIA